MTLLLALAIIFSGFTNPFTVADSTEADTVGQQKLNFILLPIVFSSPDTRLAFGVLPNLVFRTRTSSNPSSIRMDAYYTLNRQYHILLRPTLWLSNDSWNLSGKFSFKKWPTSFYGIGNSTDEEEQEKFTETLYESSLEVATRMGSHYYAGLEYALRYARITPFDDSGRLASGEITGSSNHLVTTLGILLRRDTRDNHYFPSKGSYHTLSAASSIKAIGSDFSYTRFSLDLRKYLNLSRKSSHVLALQGMVSVATGTVPFRSLASVGSTLRGYSSVRYIDRNQMALQAEYRFVPIWRRLGATIFAGAGDVFNRVDDLHPDRLKFSVGFGIRYLFSRSEKINIRLDYGFGKESSGNYLDLFEAF